MDGSINNLSELGQAIKAMREQRGLRMKDVADLAGTTRFKVGSVEAGVPTVSIHYYARISAALGAELQLGLARRPTLDEITAIMDREMK